MLNRNKSPLMGLWNGVGGKLNPGESPLSCVLREVREETGIHLETASYKGTVCWALDGVQTGGMYAFVAQIPDEWERFDTPLSVEEGILDWKQPAWIFHPDNSGVSENVPRFLPYMLEESEPCQHLFTYENDRIVSYTKSSLQEESIYAYSQARHQ